MHIYIKIPHEITLFCAVFIFMCRFYKTFVMYYFIVLWKGRVHVPWGTCGSQKINFSSQCSPSPKWVLENPMWISGWSVSASTLLFPYHISCCLFHWVFTCWGLFVCLLAVCFNRNCPCAIHSTWHAAYFNVCMRQKKRKRVRWVGYLPWFGSVTSWVGFRTP